MNLESDKRLNIQLRLDFSSAPTGEARQAGREDIESLSAVNEPESPANTSRIMEEVCERENLKKALRQVRGNKGSAGIDGMTVDELSAYLKRHWPAIWEQLLNGTYEPKPVRRVEIPKPDGGGVRKLGIPTVLDRFIQQAVMQGQRVMESITRFITQKLKLKVNEAKSAVARPQERKFLGFSFAVGPDTKRTIAPKSLERFKKRIREITRRAKGVSIMTTMAELAPYMRGWRGYFGFCETPEVLIALTRWVRLRLRSALWRQWKTPRRRRAALIALRISGQLSSNTAGSGRGPWYIARSKALSVGLSNAHFKSLGLPSLFETR